MTGNQKLLEEILYNYFPLLLQNAKRYKHPKNDIGDLFHEATELAIHAIKFYYNTESKSQFNTYLVGIIRRQIKDSIDRYAQAVTLGKHIIDKMRRHRLDPENGPLFEKYSFDDIEKLKEGLQYVDRLVIPVDDRLEVESLRHDLQRVFSSLLSDDEVYVLTSKFGMTDPDGVEHSFAMIAKELGYSVADIKQIYEDALTKIQEDEEAMNLLINYRI